MANRPSKPSIRRSLAESPRPGPGPKALGRDLGNLLSQARPARLIETVATASPDRPDPRSTPCPDPAPTGAPSNPASATPPLTSSLSPDPHPLPTPSITTDASVSSLNPTGGKPPPFRRQASWPGAPEPLVPKRTFPLGWIVLDLLLLAGAAAFVWGPGNQFPQATAIAVALGLAGSVVGALVARWFLATAEAPVFTHRTDESPSPNANPRIRVRLK